LELLECPWGRRGTVFLLRVDLRFRWHSGFHISGERVELWTDKALALDWKDEAFPTIPATTLKGWLREGAERALRGLGVEVCDASQAGTTCGICPVCEVFGHPRGKSPLFFEDVVLRDTLRSTRMGVSLSRFRRTAYEERLFSLETGFCPGFQASVRGIFAAEEKAKKAASLLFAGVRVPFALGAGRSRGLGWFSFEERGFVASVNGTSLKEEDLISELLALRAG
jgi:CRISPR/Cas system CSM-associated protein Csm3 (group 7 of RAMP superfamily)